MTREEHLAWCKKRALQYVELGKLNEALASMMADLSQHPETRSKAAGELCIMLQLSGHLSTHEEVTKFINGFH